MPYQENSHRSASLSVPRKIEKHKVNYYKRKGNTKGHTAEELFQMKYGSKYTIPEYNVTKEKAPTSQKERTKHYKRKGNIKGHTPEELFQKKIAKEKELKSQKQEFKIKISDLLYKDFLLGHNFIQYCYEIAENNTSIEFRDALSKLAKMAEENQNLPLLKACLVMVGLFDRLYSANLSKTNIGIVQSYEDWIKRSNPDETESELFDRIEDIIMDGNAEEFMFLMNMDMPDSEKEKIHTISLKVIEEKASAKIIKELLSNFSVDFDEESGSEVSLYKSIIEILEKREGEITQEMMELLVQEDVDFKELEIFFDKDLYDTNHTLSVFEEYISDKGWALEDIILKAQECEYNYLYYALMERGAGKIRDMISSADYSSIEEFLKVAQINSQIVNEAIMFLDTAYLLEIKGEIDSELFPVLSNIVKNDISEREESIGQYLISDQAIDLQELELSLEKSEGNKILIFKHLLEIHPNIIEAMYEESTSSQFTNLQSALAEYKELKSETSYDKTFKLRLKSESSIGDSDYFGSSEESGSECDPTTPILGHEGFAQMALNVAEAQ